MTLKDTHPPYPAEIPAEVVTAIVKAVNPEKMICFGMRSLRQKAWSCFLPAPGSTESVVYDILILTRADEERDRRALFDTLEHLNTDTMAINPLIHNVETVREALRNQSPFFVSVFREGLSFYENNASHVYYALNTSAPNNLRTSAEALWIKRAGLARHFLNTAADLYQKESYNLAAFMLHQAMEHCCIAMIRLITGYRATIHNLSRLIAITENFTRVAATTFPRNTPEEKKLFQLLTRSYIDARYNEDFCADPPMIAVLINRIARLHADAEILYRQRSRLLPTHTFAAKTQCQNELIEKSQS